MVVVTQPQLVRLASVPVGHRIQLRAPLPTDPLVIYGPGCIREGDTVIGRLSAETLVRDLGRIEAAPPAQSREESRHRRLQAAILRVLAEDPPPFPPRRYHEVFEAVKATLPRRDRVARFDALMAELTKLNWVKRTVDRASGPARRFHGRVGHSPQLLRYQLTGRGVAEAIRLGVLTA